MMEEDELMEEEELQEDEEQLLGSPQLPSEKVSPCYRSRLCAGGLLTTLWSKTDWLQMH